MTGSGRFSPLVAATRRPRLLLTRRRFIVGVAGLGYVAAAGVAAPVLAQAARKPALTLTADSLARIGGL